ncbi:MAG: hypothetical protein V4850_31195 [Myxococcota bacterium]
MLLSLLVGCVDPTKPNDTGTPEDTAAPTPGPASAWTASEACGGLRLHFTDGSYGLALQLRGDTDYVAVLLDGAPVSTTYELGEASFATAAEGAFADGEVCSSAEEFPWSPDTEPSWRATGGTVTIVYTADMAFPADDTAWMYDGTPLGAVTYTLEGVVLEPWGTATETFVVPELTGTVRHARVDLPA